jgi:hypothetical protein
LACGPLDQAEPGAAEPEDGAAKPEDEAPEDGPPEAPVAPRRRLDPTADEAEAIARAAGAVEGPEDGPEGKVSTGGAAAAGGGVGSFGIVGGGSVGVVGGGTTTGGAGSFTGGAGAGSVTGGLGSGGMGTVSAKACPAGRQAHTSTVVAAATLIRH